MSETEGGNENKFYTLPKYIEFKATIRRDQYGTRSDNFISGDISRHLMNNIEKPLLGRNRCFDHILKPTIKVDDHCCLLGIL